MKGSPAFINHLRSIYLKCKKSSPVEQKAKKLFIKTRIWNLFWIIVWIDQKIIAMKAMNIHGQN